MSFSEALILRLCHRARFGKYPSPPVAIEAAVELENAVQGQLIDSTGLLEILEKSKSEGTLGHELYLAGTWWIDSQGGSSE
ncbi:MAG: hypothetical protein R3C18_00455 [Planctomycetaceae bacterium]